MKAIILAAGEGTRLKKYTQELPKGMLSFKNKTIIERQIEIFKECGIDDIIIIRGFEGEKINYPNVNYYTNKKYKTTNMIESLLEAKEEFTEDCIVSYADIIFEKEIIKEMMNDNSEFLVSVDKNWKEYWQERYGKIDFDTESLKINSEGLITSLGLENPNLKEIDARYIGILKFSKNGLNIINELMESSYNEYENKAWQQSGKHIRQAYMTDLLNALIEKGYNIKAKEFNNGWLEFDTNEDYEKGIEWLKNGVINKFIKNLL